ncbi:hypothetical protein Hanom_Chr07g00654291 [Helianthus anomalus]
MGQIISPALLMISNYNHAIFKIIDQTSNYYGYYKLQSHLQQCVLQLKFLMVHPFSSLIASIQPSCRPKCCINGLLVRKIAILTNFLTKYK